jgi:hypothetical protein
VAAKTGRLDVGIVQPGRFLKAMPDSNYTLLSSEWENGILEFTGTLTATRTITLPLTDADGFVYLIRNATTQSLTFQGASGTGVTIATVKSAIIYTDGVNYYRLTADA